MSFGSTYSFRAGLLLKVHANSLCLLARRLVCRRDLPFLHPDHTRANSMLCHRARSSTTLSSADTKLTVES
jgi:hypothetical protein